MKGISQEAAKHEHLAVGKINHAGCFINDHQTKGDEGIQRPRRYPRRHEITEHLHDLQPLGYSADFLFSPTEQSCHPLEQANRVSGYIGDCVDDHK